MGKFREGNLVLKSNQVIKIGTAQVNYDGSDLVLNKPVKCEGIELASGPAITEITTSASSDSTSALMTALAIQSAIPFVRSIGADARIYSTKSLDSMNRIKMLSIEEDLGLTSFLASTDSHKFGMAFFSDSSYFASYRDPDNLNHIEYIIGRDGTTVVQAAFDNSENCFKGPSVSLPNGNVAVAHVRRASRSVMITEVDSDGNFVNGPTAIYTQSSDVPAYVNLKCLPNGHLYVQFVDTERGAYSTRYLVFMIVKPDGTVIKSETDVNTGDITIGEGSLHGHHNATVRPNGSIVSMWEPSSDTTGFYYKVLDYQGDILIGPSYYTTTHQYNQSWKIISFNDGRVALAYINGNALCITTFDTYMSVLQELTGVTGTGSYFGAGYYDIGKACLPDNTVLFYYRLGAAAAGYTRIDNNGSIVSQSSDMFGGDCPWYSYTAQVSPDGSLFFTADRYLANGKFIGSWKGTGTRIHGYLQLASGASVNEITTDLEDVSATALITASARVFKQTANGTIYGGPDSGASLTDGANNVLAGNGSGYYLEDGAGNVFVGYQSGYGKNGGTNSSARNVFVGYQCGYTIDVGGYNVAIGSENVKLNENASALVAIGYNCLEETTEATNGNVAIGVHCSRYLESGDGANVCIGYLCGRGHASNPVTYEYNVLMGYNASNSLESGDYNVAIGYQPLTSNISADGLIAIGHEAGRSVTSQTTPTIFLGYDAGAYLKSGEGANVIIGYRSGYGAGTSNGTFSKCTIVGSEAGYSILDGHNNTLVGVQTGYNIVNGEGNVFIGYRAGYYEDATTSNTLIIANNDTNYPLIKGDFANDLLTINGRITVEKDTAGTYNATTISAFFGDSQQGQVDNIYIIGNTINSGFGYGASTTGLWVNYRGYNGATSYFRDFLVGDGKGNTLVKFTGSTLSAVFEGVTQAYRDVDDYSVNHTLTASDRDKVLVFDSTAVVEIPSNASEAIKIGFECTVIQKGDEQVKFNTDGGAVETVSLDGNTLTSGRGAVVRVIKIATDLWSLSGDLV